MKMFDYYELIKPIPEPLIVRDAWDGEYNGHVEYTGHGSGKDYDYWNCYCLRSGGPPPTHLDQLIINVSEPQKVRD